MQLSKKHNKTTEEKHLYQNSKQGLAQLVPPLGAKSTSWQTDLSRLLVKKIWIYVDHLDTWRMRYFVQLSVVLFCLSMCVKVNVRPFYDFLAIMFELFLIRRE